MCACIYLSLLQRIRALVIGINQYKHYRSLNNAVHDAQTVKEMLEGAGVEVYFVANANIQQLNEAVAKYTASLQEGEVALVYFAGHGCEFNNAPRLLAKSIGPVPNLRKDAVNVFVMLDRFDSKCFCLYSS